MSRAGPVMEQILDENIKLRAMEGSNARQTIKSIPDKIIPRGMGPPGEMKPEKGPDSRIHAQ